MPTTAGRKRDADYGGLDRHESRECLHLLQIRSRVKTDASFVGASRITVLDAVRGNHQVRTVISHKIDRLPMDKLRFSEQRAFLRGKL